MSEDVDFNITPIADEVPVLPKTAKQPSTLRRLASGGVAALALATGAANELGTEPVGPDENTQEQVWSTEAGGIAGGLEGDGNGMFNTREPITVHQGKYSKDGILDHIPGVPNIVFGTADKEKPAADEAPLGDGTYTTEAEKSVDKTKQENHYIEIPIKIPTKKTSEKVVTKNITVHDSGNTQYERDFTTDRKTFEQASTPAKEIASQTLEYVEKGYTVQGIKVIGLASGEDHTNPSDTMANIGEPSQNNQELAGERASHGLTALQTALNEKGVDSSQSALEIESREIEPTDEQISELIKLADEYGMSVYDFTDKFNLSLGKFSPEALTTLVDSLVNNRGVIYEVNLSKNESTTTVEYDHTVIKLPLNIIEKIIGDKPTEERAFRIEVPGEILLILLAFAIRKIPIPSSPGLPKWPKTPRTNPPRIPPNRPPIPEPPKIPVPTIKIPGVIDVPPDGPPPPPSFDKKDAFRPVQSISRNDRQYLHKRRKQPREFNFSNQRGYNFGGPGKRERDKGGNASNKRG